MTDDDKALVKRVRLWGEHALTSHLSDLVEAADLIEAQAAEIERLQDELSIAQDFKECCCSHDTPDTICVGHLKLFDRLSNEPCQMKAVAKIERLRGIVALWLDLATGPDEMGDYHRQKQAIKASQEALEETLHVSETCKENGETFT